MAWKTYFGFLIILLVNETATEDLCKESPDAVAVCKTVVDVKRQLFIPINNTIDDGCQCTVKLVSATEDQFTDTVETKFLNTDECGFNASTELDGVLDTLTCNNSLVTKDMETGNEMIYRFIGSSDDDATVCLQIVPRDGNSRINIICSDQITDPNTAPTTEVSSTTLSATPSTSPASISTATPSTSAAPTSTDTPSTSPALTSTSTSLTSASPTPSPDTLSTSPTSPSTLPSAMTAGSSPRTPSESRQQPTKSTPDVTDVNSPTSTTSKPNHDEPDITFIIILIGSCVGGFLIILLIILLTWCIIYRRKKKQLEAEKALPYNETGRHSLEGIQVENELFILAYKDDEQIEESKETNINEKPVNDQSQQECEVDLGDQLPDVVKPSDNGIKKVNFDVPDPTEALPEESVTEFKTDTISMNDEAVVAMTGRIQL